MTRYATSRQKSCHQCSRAKAKCDRKADGCGRCAWKAQICSYSLRSSDEEVTVAAKHGNVADLRRDWSSAPHDLGPASEPVPYTSAGVLVDEDVFGPSLQSPLAVDDSTLVGNTSLPAPDSCFTPDAPHSASTAISQSEDRLDFADLELICPINADEISNRWLNSYVPTLGQAAKNYPPSVSHFIRRTLQSFTAVAVHGRGVPPFLHHSQMTVMARYPSLATCLSVVRICEKTTHSTRATLADVLLREMDRLHHQYGNSDSMGHLCVFQAYLIYAMVLYFHLNPGPSPSLRQAMINIQELACASSKQGLLCPSEQQAARPRWEAWIVTEAKRRTLYTMYLFDNLLSAEDNLPTFLGTELRGLPAPANKHLWQASTRRSWEISYNNHLAEWVDGGLHIDELWPVPSDTSPEALQERRSRVDHWLEGVDEFGMMLYAVTSCTHGS